MTDLLRQWGVEESFERVFVLQYPKPVVTAMENGQWSDVLILMRWQQVAGDPQRYLQLADLWPPSQSHVWLNETSVVLRPPPRDITADTLGRIAADFRAWASSILSSNPERKCELESHIEALESARWAMTWMSRPPRWRRLPRP